MNIFNVVFIILVCYIGLVYFYLKHITNKYLKVVIDLSTALDNRLKLKTNQMIREKYADNDVINILVLTGGGVRGIVPLQILNKLEEATGKKTGELFEFMAGTSTGAINCAILSVPDGDAGYKFSSQDISRDYVRNIRRMFSAPWYHHILTLFGIFGPRYLPEGKLEILEGYFADCTLADLQNNLIVPVYDLSENALRVIRNWEPSLDGNYTNYFLRDLIHGASNPPMLFSPRRFFVGGKTRVFIDPGVILNNPAEVALLNAWFMFPNKKIRIVLIGNGGNDAESYGHTHMAEFGAYGLFQYLLNSPIISSKFSTDLVQEYIYEARDYGLDVDFVYINSDGGHELSTVDTSSQNMEKINQYAARLMAENQEKIDYLISVLK
ncbi:MAG: patatin-like phospholipase family protein [Burkholderiales bacterium]|nr:patatin-like phospholipase family protein [Burkholderiales bacterium]